MGLDILTPKGQKTLADLDKAISLFLQANPGLSYTPTPDDQPADVDGVVAVRGGAMRAVVEVKCRYEVSLDHFQTRFNNEWLVTMDKLTRGAAVSRALSVPLYGFLYLVEGNTLLTKRITGSDGLFTTKFRCDCTETQRTVNGGTAVRANAYIDMRDSKVYG